MKVSLSARKPTTVIEVEVYGDAAQMLPELLRNMKIMGSFGSSRGITIEDWAHPDETDTEKYSLRSSFGFDGDGADKIGYIKVNGKEYK